MEKYFTTGETTDDNMAHGNSMLDTEGYKRTLRLCNSYSFLNGYATAHQCYIYYLYCYLILDDRKASRPVRFTPS
jgi:hypothetical protein